jgi:hypothetical protein
MANIPRRKEWFISGVVCQINVIKYNTEIDFKKWKP